MSGIGGPAQDGPRTFGLPHAKVYRPTAEEWADPLCYISRIRSDAEPCGIAKIIPPEGWAPPFAINKAVFKFSSKIQAVHELQDRLALQPRQEFAEDLHRCMVQEGKAMKKPPVFGGKEIDLYKMFRAVSKRGGYAAVTEDKKWKDIVRILQVGIRLLFSK
jgi:histone demethylase JARID1